VGIAGQDFVDARGRGIAELHQDDDVGVGGGDGAAHGLHVRVKGPDVGGIDANDRGVGLGATLRRRPLGPGGEEQEQGRQRADGGGGPQA
jgi:hypothetical protein